MFEVTVTNTPLEIERGPYESDISSCFFIFSACGKHDLRKKIIAYFQSKQGEREFTPTFMVLHKEDNHVKRPS